MQLCFQHIQINSKVYYILSKYHHPDVIFYADEIKITYKTYLNQIVIRTFQHSLLGYICIYIKVLYALYYHTDKKFDSRGSVVMTATMLLIVVDDNDATT